MANTLDCTRAVFKSPDVLPMILRSSGGLHHSLHSSGCAGGEERSPASPAPHLVHAQGAGRCVPVCSNAQLWDSPGARGFAHGDVARGGSRVHKGRSELDGHRGPDV